MMRERERVESHSRIQCDSLNQNNSVKKRDPNGIQILGLTYYRHSGRDPWFSLTIQDISVQHAEVILKWLLWIKEYSDIL